MTLEHRSAGRITTEHGTGDPMGGNKVAGHVFTPSLVASLVYLFYPEVKLASLRRMAVEFLIPVITNIETARALVDSMAKNGYDSTSRVLLLNDLLKNAPLSKYI